MSDHPTPDELRARLEHWERHIGVPVGFAALLDEAIAALETAERERDAALAAYEDERNRSTTSGRSHSNPVFPLEIPEFRAPTPGAAEQGESTSAPTAAGAGSWSTGDARRTLVCDPRPALARAVARRFARTTS